MPPCLRVNVCVCQISQSGHVINNSVRLSGSVSLSWTTIQHICQKKSIPFFHVDNTLFNFKDILLQLKNKKLTILSYRSKGKCIMLFNFNKYFYAVAIVLEWWLIWHIYGIFMSLDRQCNSIYFSYMSPLKTLTEINHILKQLGNVFHNILVIQNDIKVLLTLTFLKAL